MDTSPMEPPGWPPADRALLRRVVRRMIRAGLWRAIRTAGFRPGRYVQIFCPDCFDPTYEIGRALDGRYVVIDRETGGVSLHPALEDALATIARIPFDEEH